MYVQPYFDNYDCHFCCSGNSAAPLKKQKPLKSVEPIPLKRIKIYFQGGIQPTQFSGLLVQIYLHFDPQPAAPFFFFSKLAEKQFPRIHQS